MERLRDVFLWRGCIIFLTHSLTHSQGCVIFFVERLHDFFGGCMIFVVERFCDFFRLIDFFCCWRGFLIFLLCGEVAFC